MRTSQEAELPMSTLKEQMECNQLITDVITNEHEGKNSVYLISLSRFAENLGNLLQDSHFIAKWF